MSAGRSGRFASRERKELRKELLVEPWAELGLVASDGHRAHRPPTLDASYAACVERLGPARARSLFDGSALGTF